MLSPITITSTYVRAEISRLTQEREECIDRIVDYVNMDWDSKESADTSEYRKDAKAVEALKAQIEILRHILPTVEVLEHNTQKE